MGDINVTDTKVFYPTIVLCLLIAIISLYLIILFIKAKTFKNWNCINIVTFSILLFLDNIFRIVPFVYVDNYAWTVIQAFCLVLLDKLILSTLTMQSIILYIGLYKNKFYNAHEKAIFITTFMIGFIISLTLTIIFMSKGVRRRGLFAYCNNSEIKTILDTIQCAIYVVINLFCNLRALCYILSIKKEADSVNLQDINYNHYLIRIIFLIILNTITYLEVFLIIYHLLHGDFADFFYLLICFAIAIYNGFNEVVIKETLKIFCKKSYEEKLEKVKSLKLLGTTNQDDNKKKK